MDVLERIKSVCSVDPTRSNLLTPFGVEWAGRKWAAGTDGRALAMVHFEGELRTEGAPQIASPGISILPGPGSTHTADIEALRAWAGAASPPLITCDACKGTPPPKCSEFRGEGSVAAHDCDCPHCDGEHPCSKCRGKNRGGCDRCNSSGKTAAPIRGGKLGGVVFDRNLVGRVLAAGPATGRIEVSLTNETSPAYFRGEGWIGIVMPLSRLSDAETKDLLEFTSLQPIPSEKVG